MLVFKSKLLPAIGLISVLLIASLQSWAQSVTVKGTVVKSGDNTPLAGVTVIDPATKKGTKTDQNGFFTLNVTGNKTTLVFSNVGFETYTLRWDGVSLVAVILEPVVSSMEDVVVVGYGKQKKVNQTGATQTVKFDGPVNTPVTNSAQLMYGKFSGVQITQSSGLPGADASSVVIRGVGTFGATNPLVVIDNIQYIGLDAFNNLAPSDIESISVLKDASASSIYGSRAGNGVILVTTKKGKKGVFSVDYNGYTGVQSVTTTPKYLDAVNYAILKNERDINTNGATAPLRYSAANIQAIKDGTDPDLYANTNWAKEILRTAPVQNHYLSVSGGSDKITYRLSLGYLSQDAVVKGKFESKRYNLGINLTADPKPWLNFTNVTNVYWSRFKGPTGGADAITGETGIINQFQRSSPTIPAYYSNGNYGIVDGSYQNVNFSFPATNALMRGMLGVYGNNDINIAERLAAKINFTKDFSFESSGSLNMKMFNYSDFSPSYNTYDYDGILVAQNVTNTLRQNSSLFYKLMNENIFRYTKKINRIHDINVLLGHSIVYDRSDGFTGSLQGFPSNSVYQFDGGGVLNPFVTGSGYEEAWQSFFSRVNYSLKDRYLFEFNIRRDGSSKFSSTNRYGNFPSASAGWRMSRENFMKNISWISELKIRGSWGITGNDQIDNYIYDQTYNSNLDYTLGGSTVVGAVAITSLANPNITWETVKQYDIGIDADLLKNRLSVTADYFVRNSSDILYGNFPIPNTIGVTNLAANNAAGMQNKGLELSVNYRGVIGNLNYSLGGSMSKFADNRVTNLGDRGLETIGARSIIRIGVPFNAYYGYKVLGIFQSTDEVAKSPVQFGSTKTAPGDFKYADLSGPNGVPDGVINAFDRTIIGNPYPKLMYNFNATAGMKGFDFNLVLQGVNGIDRILMDNGQQPLPDDRNNALSYWVNRWTPDNKSTTLPRVGGQNNTVVSDFYVQDASYLRLKNIELGYSIPLSFTKRYNISKLRFFVGGQNVLTFTKMKNFDPERLRGTGTDQTTPLYKIYTVGLNLKF